MDTTIPNDIASALEEERRRRRCGTSRYRVAAGDALHPVVELTQHGLVIEADAPPHLRGYVDIFEGDERVARRLCVCVSAVDGLVRYEFKRESGIGQVPADHVGSGLAGLLAPPER